MFARNVLKSAQKAGRSGVATQKRSMGSSSKKVATPYDLPSAAGYPAEAYPLGLVPGAKAEGWEVITGLCYVACTGLLVFGLSAKEDDSFKSWARREAIARERVVLAGGEIEFGKYYSGNRYQNAGDLGDTIAEQAEDEEE